MARVNLDKMSMDELKALKADVETAIAGYEKKRREDALREMEEVAKKHGLSVSELIGGTGRKTAKAKSPAKYRNPENPDQTWSGRGRQPAWFKSALESGKSPDDMAI